MKFALKGRPMRITNQLPWETNWSPIWATISPQSDLLGVLLSLEIVDAILCEFFVWPEQTQQSECQDHAGQRNRPLFGYFCRVSFCAHTNLLNRLRASTVDFSFVSEREAVTRKTGWSTFIRDFGFDGFSAPG